MSRARTFLVVTALLTMMLTALVVDGIRRTRQHTRRQLPAVTRLAATLQITDLALWGEARYTRHPSQADLFTPFQDFPGSPEHFPAGSLLSPEPLRRRFGQTAAGD